MEFELSRAFLARQFTVFLLGVPEPDFSILTVVALGSPRSRQATRQTASLP